MVFITGYVLAVSAATLVATPVSYVAHLVLFPPRPEPPLSRDARHLLERLLALADGPLPEFLFDVPMSGLSVPSSRPGLEELVASARVTRDPHTGMFSIPQSVRDTMPGRRPAEALYWIDAAFRGNPQDPRDRRYLDLLAPHAAAVIASAEDESITIPTVDLMKRLGVLLREDGQEAEAAALFQRAIALEESNFGTHNPDIERDLQQLATLPPDQPSGTQRRVFGRNIMRLAMINATADA